MTQKESIYERFADHRIKLQNARLYLQVMIDVALEERAEITITDMDLSPIVNTENSSFQVSQIKGDCVYGKDEDEVLKCVLIKNLSTDVICELVEILFKMEILF